MACGGHLLGWEAETGLTALPCVHVDLSVASQEAAVCTELGRLHCHQWGAGTDSKYKHPSTLQCAEVSQIFPFLSFLKSCVVSSLFFLVLAHPEAATILERAESCLQPESWLSEPRADLLSSCAKTSPNSPFTVWKRICTPSCASC